MMGPATIVIPCRHFSVQVTLHTTAGLSQLERFVLQAVALGANKARDLERELAVSPRMILDTCVDMLEAGYLTIDSINGSLHLSEHVSEHMGDPTTPKPTWYEKLSSAAPPQPQTYELSQDLISGSIFPYRRPRFEPRKGLPHAPMNPDIAPLDDISKLDLLLATVDAVRRRERFRKQPDSEQQPKSDEEEFLKMQMMREGRVGDVSIVREANASGAIGRTQERQYPLFVRMLARRSDDDRTPPNIQIVGPDWIPSTTRRRMEDGLVDLWQRRLGRGKNQFFSKIRYHDQDGEDSATVTVADPRRDVEEFAKLGAKLDESSSSQPSYSDITALHEEFAAKEMDVRAEVEELCSYEASPELVFGASAHHDLALKALREAKQQVVLACPWVGQLAAGEAFRDAIGKAVERGVSVHLLWGIGETDRREQVFGDILPDLLRLTERSPQGGRLQLPGRSSRHHAKLIVCDLDWAVITSCNFLNAPRGRTVDEVGVCIRAAAGASASVVTDERPAPARAVVEVIEWARRTLPEYELRRHLQSSPVLFGRRDFAAPLPIGEAVTLPGEKAPALGLSLWKRDWQDRIASYEERLNNASFPSVATCDDENRRVLIHALENARQRLYIASPDLGSGILGAVPVQRMYEARARGADVAVCSQKWTEVARFDPEYRTRYASLQEAGVRFLDIDSHAKILVCDDWAVVGSFNFLSYEGGRRGELGIRIFSSEIAGKLTDHLQTLAGNDESRGSTAITEKQ